VNESERKGDKTCKKVKELELRKFIKVEESEGK
jgi:hypothetical protein